MLWGPGFEALEEGPRVVRHVVGKLPYDPLLWRAGKDGPSVVLMIRLM